MVAAGMFHFVRPQLYIRIMPPYFPAHSTLVLLSGIAEMVLGFMLLNPETQQLAAWGIIIMLLLFLTVHTHMLRNEEASMNLPKWVLWLRIPLQFLLIYWVYQYT